MGNAIILLNPLLFAIIGLAIVKFRRLDWREDVGFRAIEPRHLLLWGAAFLALAIAQEAIGWLTGAEGSAGSWRGKYNGANLALRIVAVGLLYPIAEEFLFRGVMLGALARRFGPIVAVVGSALAFAAVHIQYDLAGMGFVLADGLLFGAARVASRSVYLPMLFHVVGNSYAVWERLFG